MTVQNTEVLIDKKIEQVEKKEMQEDKALNYAAQLERGDIKLENVPPEYQREIHERFIVNQEGIPEPEPVKKETVDVLDEKTTVVKQVETPASIPADEDKAKFLLERKQRLDELNSIEQKAKAAEERLRKIGTIPALPVKKNYDELTDDEGVKIVLKRQDDIETRQNEELTEKKTTLETELVSIKRDKMFMEISILQNDDNSLKTSKPIQTLNAQYKLFVEAVGGLANVDKFRNDKLFREQVESKGIVFPMSEEDYGKFDTISKINHFKINNKYPSFSSAHYDYQRELGIVPDAVRKAALDATQDVLDKVGGGEGGATTLSPGDGSVKNTDVKMTDAQMLAWLKSHPKPKTPEDIAMAEFIHMEVTKRKG